MRTFFSRVSLFVFGIGTSRTNNFCHLSCPSVSHCLFVLAHFSLSSLSCATLHLPALQSSEPVERSGPAGSGVPRSAPRGGRVPHGAQVQERPCSEAQDPPPGTVSAAASGWPLPD